MINLFLSIIFFLNSREINQIPVANLACPQVMESNQQFFWDNMESQNHTAFPLFSSRAIPWEAGNLRKPSESTVSANLCELCAYRISWHQASKYSHGKGHSLGWNWTLCKGSTWQLCKPLFYQAFWDLLMRSFHTSEMALSLKTLAVWRGLLTAPELLFSLRVRSLHSCKSVKQHHTSTNLCAQPERCSWTRKTSAEHTRVLALYQKLIPPLKCTMTKRTAFQKGHLQKTIPGHMEIIKLACKADGVSKALYLL